MTTLYKAKIKLGQELDKEKTSWITGNLLHKESANKNTGDSFYILPKNFTVFDGKLNDQIPVKSETICQHVTYYFASGGDIFANDLLVSLNHDLTFIVKWNSQFYTWELVLQKTVFSKKTKSTDQNTQFKTHNRDSSDKQLIDNLLKGTIPHNSSEFNVPYTCLKLINSYWKLTNALPLWIIDYLELEKYGNMHDHA